MGGELFQLDAGWYPPVTPGSYDFSAGLGSWTVDRERFPGGLGALSDYAHERGLRFGVWANPSASSGDRRPRRRGPRAVPRAPARPVRAGRSDAEATHAQVCLADEEAWDWVRERLFPSSTKPGPTT